MSKVSKKENFVGGISLVVLGFFSDIPTMYHWIVDEHLILTNYPYYTPFIGLISKGIIISLLYPSKNISKFVLTPFLLGLIYNLVLIYAMFGTYPDKTFQLIFLSITVPLLLVGIFWSISKD